MATIQDLGRAFKIENPSYSDLSDEDAGRLAKIAGKGEYDDIEDIALAVRKDQGLSAFDSQLERVMNSGTTMEDLLQADPNLRKNLQIIFNDLNPNRGVVGNLLKRWKAGGLNKFLAVRGEGLKSFLEQSAAVEVAVIEGRRKHSEWMLYAAQNAYSMLQLRQLLELTQKANNSGYDVETYVKRNYEQEVSQLRINEHRTIKAIDDRLARADHQRELERLAQISRDKIREESASARIATDNAIIIAQEELRLAIIADNLNNQEIMILIQDLIDQEYIKIANTWRDPNIPEEAKRQIAHSRERMIQMFMRQQDETQNKVLQSRS